MQQQYIIVTSQIISLYQHLTGLFLLYVLLLCECQICYIFLLILPFSPSQLQYTLILTFFIIPVFSLDSMLSLISIILQPNFNILLQLNYKQITLSYQSDKIRITILILFVINNRLIYDFALIRQCNLFLISLFFIFQLFSIFKFIVLLFYVSSTKRKTDSGLFLSFVLLILDNCLCACLLLLKNRQDFIENYYNRANFNCQRRQCEADHNASLLITNIMSRTNRNLNSPPHHPSHPSAQPEITITSLQQALTQALDQNQILLNRIIELEALLVAAQQLNQQTQARSKQIPIRVQPARAVKKNISYKKGMRKSKKK